MQELWCLGSPLTHICTQFTDSRTTTRQSRVPPHAAGGTSFDFDATEYALSFEKETVIIEPLPVVI